MEWIVEPQVLIKAADLFNLVFTQVEATDVQVLFETSLVITLWDDCDASLSGPSQ